MQSVDRPLIWRYALAHYGKSLFWYASELLFPFYLTEIGLLNGWSMSIVIGLSIVLGMLADLSIGWLIRRCLSHTHGAGRCQVVGASLSVLSILGLFACVWMPVAWHIKYTLALLICFRFAYAIYDISQDVLVNLAAAKRAQRFHLSGIHFSFSGIASMTVAVFVVPMVAVQNYTNHGRFFFLTGLLFTGALASSLQLGRYLGRLDVRSHTQPHLTRRPSSHDASPSFYFLVNFLLCLCGPIFTKVIIYYGTYAVGSPFAGGITMALYSLGVVLAFPVLGKVMRETPRLSAMRRLSLVMVIIGALMMAFAGSYEYFLHSASLVLGMVCGALGILCWSGFADALSREQANKISFDYARFLASAKMGLLASTILIGATLSSLNYKSAQARDLMMLMSWPLIIVGCALTLICRVRHAPIVSR